MMGWDDAINEGLKIVNKFVPDPSQAAAAAKEFQERMNERRLAQVQLDSDEIKSGSVLGRWRGALGWACACSFIYQFIAHPVLVAALLISNPAFPVEKLPKLDWPELGKVLMGMLGLA